MNEPFADLEFNLYVAHQDLRAFFVDGKSAAGKRVSRLLERGVMRPLQELAKAQPKPVPRTFPASAERVLRANTHAAYKDLPAAYRGLLQGTFKLGEQLHAASKKGTAAKAARPTLVKLAKQMVTLARAIEAGPKAKATKAKAKAKATRTTKPRAR